MDSVENRCNDEGQATKGHCQLCPVPARNSHRDLLRRKRDLKLHWKSRARRTRQIYTGGRLCDQKKPRVDNTSPPDPVGASSHATKVKEELYGLVQRTRDPCVHSNVCERMWTMRHMDDNVVVGPPAKVKELSEDMGHTMLLKNVQNLEPGKPPVKFLGWMLERTADGFRLMINPQLIEDIVQDSWLASRTRKCATAGVKDWVVDETPLELPNTNGRNKLAIPHTTLKHSSETSASLDVAFWSKSRNSPYVACNCSAPSASFAIIGSKRLEIKPFVKLCIFSIVVFIHCPQGRMHYVENNMWGVRLRPRSQECNYVGKSLRPRLHTNSRCVLQVDIRQEHLQLLRGAYLVGNTHVLQAL